MAQVRLERVGGKEFIAAPEGLCLWIVCKHWTGGRVDRVAAYFSEALARTHAGELVGKEDRVLIGLECFPVKDAPPHS
jgi:hypothetical protein